MAHTPGPWRVWKQTDPDITEPTAYVAKVGELYVVGNGELGRQLHDAQLIAAAPDLLATCEKALVYLKRLEMRGIVVSDTLIEVLNYAIAKARGEDE